MSTIASAYFSCNYLHRANNDNKNKKNCDGDKIIISKFYSNNIVADSLKLDKVCKRCPFTEYLFRAIMRLNEVCENFD